MNAVPQSQPRARILTCTEQEYYDDPCEVPSLSQSIAKVIVKQSPLHAFTEHPRLGKTSDGEGEPPTEAIRDGTVIHKLLLGQGPKLDIIDASDYRTQRAKDLRDAAFNAGRVPVLQHRMTDLTEIAAKLRANFAGFGFDLTDGLVETPIEWLEEGIHGPVVCRGKPDLMNLERATIFDVKKISSADPETCARHMYDYGYDIQWAAYTSAVEKMLPEFAGRIDMVFGFCEITAPYAVYPARPDGMMRELGLRRWRRAVTVWEHCLREKRWPSYTDRIATLEAPLWVLRKEEMLADV